VSIERAAEGEDFVEVGRRPSDKGRFLDLGLLPKTEYRYRLRSCNETGCGPAKGIGSATTEESLLPELNVTVPAEGDDVLIFGVYRATLDPSAPGQLVAVDRKGKVLWEVHSQSGIFVEVEPLPDGTIIAERGSDLVWYDLDHTVKLQYSGSFVHHDIDRLSDGRFAFIAYDIFETQPGYSVLGDSIRILGNDFTTIDWEWRCRDHIPLTDVPPDMNIVLWGLGHDWTHANTIVFDESAGRVYLSVRNLNRLYAIDYPSGEVAWVMGDGGDFGQGLFDHAHGFELVAPNRFLVLDNRTFMPPPKYSRVIEIGFDAEARRAEVVWEYRGTPDFYTDFLGAVQKQPNDEVLVTDGTNGRIFQVSRGGQITLELIIEAGFFTYKAVTVPRSFFTDW